MAKPKHPRHTKAQWAKLIKDKQHHLSVSNFYVWRAWLNTPETTTLTDKDWLSIDLSPPVSAKPSWDIELDLPGGMMLRMRSA